MLNIRRLYDIPYSFSGTEANQLNLFLPEDNPSGLCVMLIHGGGWSSGNKEQWKSVPELICSWGYACASIGYRLAPEHNYPAQLDDVRQAAAFLKQQAPNYGYNADRLVAMGSSAGAYLATMLALLQPNDPLGQPVLPAAAAREKMMDTRPKAVVLYCPVTDLYTGQSFVKSFMGGTSEDMPELYREASPMERPAPTDISFFIVQGDADSTTPLDRTEIFCDRINSNGGQAKLVVLPGITHGFGYGTETDAQQAALCQVMQYLKECAIDK